VAVEKSARNLPDVKTLRANYLNIRDILGYDYLLLPKSALDVVESFLG
jgi:large subunit ribosomal protein L4